MPEGGGSGGRWRASGALVARLGTGEEVHWLSLDLAQDAQANDNSGYIGAGIVGAFIVVVASWFGGRKVVRKWRSRRTAVSAADAPAERVE